MPLSPTEDQRLSVLMRQSQQGDKKAYNELLVYIATVLKGFFQKRLGHGPEAEDLVQEVLVSIHGSRHSYDSTKRFAPWMYSIARYRLADYWRTQLKRLQNEVSDERDHEDKTESNGAVATVLHEKIVLALNALPEKQRRVVHLLKVNGYTIQETAQTMKMTETAIKVTAHRAYKALRKQFKEESHANE
jgi:RNA polymerase sigma-70 factor, ECF subfamily